ncbi:MAG TPA: HEAT repeat domain-containing protein [Planctomycetota bacterium]|nr:HEAT repeat domain-containing protein [Planctomycetota bacterium]
MEAIPVLVECFEDPAPRVRREAASILAVFGSAAQAVLPALKKLLHDPEESVQGDAEMTIKIIEGEDGWAPPP